MADKYHSSVHQVLDSVKHLERSLSTAVAFQDKPATQKPFFRAMPETASGSLQFAVMCRCSAGCFVKVCFNMSRCRAAKMRTSLTEPPKDGFQTTNTKWLWLTLTKV